MFDTVVRCGPTVGASSARAPRGGRSTGLAGVDALREDMGLAGVDGSGPFRRVEWTPRDGTIDRKDAGCGDGPGF